MSEMWGYYCLDCNLSSSHDVNHGEERLSTFVELNKTLPVIVPALYEFVDFHWPWIDYKLWLDEHKGHRIELINEYGERKIIK